MLDGKVYKQGWSLDDIDWTQFDASKVEPWMLTAIKAAALVEFNAPDYVTYLKRVFKDRRRRDASPIIEQWGREESQHGQALGRWAEMADPNFKLDETFARFRKGYRPAHFAKRGRCFGARLAPRRDDRALRGRKRHLLLLHRHQGRHRRAGPEGDRRADRRRRIPSLQAVLRDSSQAGRTGTPLLEEAAGSPWAASASPTTTNSPTPITAPPCRPTGKPPRLMSAPSIAQGGYNTTLRIYRRRHIRKLTQMVAKAVGANPHGRLTRLAEATAVADAAPARRAVGRAGPRRHDRQTLRFTSICLISPMALAGFRPFGQALAQFMIVWQR